MPHTDGRYQQALGFNDGIIMLLPSKAVNTGDAAAATRNAAGDFSWHVVNNKAPVFSFNLADGQLMRTGYTDADLQVSNPSANSVDAYPQGYPPMAGVSYITPRTALRLKGIKLLSVSVIYKVTTTDLTSFNLQMDKTVLADGAAPVVTSIIAVGQNGLSLAQQANLHAVEVAIPGAQQVYCISDLSQYWLELSPVTPVAGGSAFDLYAVRVKVEFNFN